MPYCPEHGSAFMHPPRHPWQDYAYGCGFLFWFLLGFPIAGVALYVSPLTKDSGWAGVVLNIFYWVSSLIVLYLAASSLAEKARRR